MLDLFPAPPPPSFVSTPVTNPQLGISSSPARRARDRSIRLPARRRRPSTMPPAKELHRRRLRSGTKLGMIDAICSVLEELEDPPFALTPEHRSWLAKLVSRPCRAHRGTVEIPCPGPTGEPPCYGDVREPLELCEHSCPGSPKCPGSMGRLVSCDHARLYEERGCGWWLAEPLSCHVPGCPDCEPQRQAKHAVHYEAVIAPEDPRDIVLGVFTARNPRAGELAPALRAQARHLARLRRTPLFTGRGPCEARTETGAPFHPCAHREHVWRCRLADTCRADLRSANRGRRRRARRRCALIARSGRACEHASCRPNCSSYRHRGVAGGVWATECPPSTETPGTWNLHTNAVLVLRSSDGRHFGWLAPWQEISWYWRRATCATHRRCPGRPLCEGGAWDVHIEGYEPREGIREYIKYVTKPAEILEHAGPAGLIEFLLARRRLKFLSSFGSFFGRPFRVDPDDQELADAETVDVWISDFRTKRFPKVCPSCGLEGQWSGDAVIAPRVKLALENGWLGWRAPPIPVPKPIRMLPIAAPRFVPLGVSAADYDVR